MFGLTDEQMIRTFDRMDRECDKDLTIEVRSKITNRRYGRIFPTNPNLIGFWIIKKTDLAKLKIEHEDAWETWTKGKEFLSKLTDTDEVLEYYYHSGSHSSRGYVVYRPDDTVIELCYSSCMH